jgi:serine/threonine-protein kinase
MVLTEEPPRPRSIESSVPEALELVIQKAMAKDPEERYSSMAELDAELALFEPETHATLSLIPPPGHPSKKAHKTTVAAATARSPSVGDVERTTRKVKLSRPTLVFLTFVLYVWLIGCAIDFGTAALAFLRGALPTSTEQLIVAITVGAISLTPLVFWLRHIRTTWQNSVRSVELAQTMRRIVLWATVPYAFMTLALRVLNPFADPRWAPLLPAASLALVFLGSTVARIARSR